MKRHGWQLVYADTGEPAHVGETVYSLRGVPAVITDFRPPARGAVCGLVTVRREERTRNDFPGVYRLRIVPVAGR